MSSDIKYILAIDLGTSGPKVVLVSVFGDILDHEFEKTDTTFLPDGGVEENPDDWWNAIIKAAKRLLSKNLVPTDDIIAICCTSQWSGTVAVDKKGNHLMNAITWMDSRGAAHVKKITNGLIKIEGYGISKLYKWLLKYVEKLIKKKMKHINIIGGGAKSDLWCQIHADILNRTIRRVKDPIQANARGAGLLGSVALGYLKFNEIPGRTEYDSIFKPNPKTRKLYKKLFKEYQAIYKQNKKIHKRLNK